MHLENEKYYIDMDRNTGILTKITDKVSGLDFISESKLSENFRLLVPIPELEANYLYGTEYGLSEIKKDTDKLKLIWRGPFVNNYGSFNLEVTEHIELKEDFINFRIEVENNTEFLLAEVWHSFMGGITGFGNPKDTLSLVPFWGWSNYENIFKFFPETIGDCGGLKFPEIFCSYPYKLPMPWISLYNMKLKRGAYFAVHDSFTRMHTLRAEAHPGLSRHRIEENWPTKEEIKYNKDLFPSGLVLHWVNMPYTKPGNVFKGPEVVLKFHDGDWHNAAKIYRKWFTSNFKVRNYESGWLHNVQAIQTSECMLSEGNIHMTFKDIPGWAADAKEYDVKTVLITGWNKGGWDRGYPEYCPDPKLGTYEDLADSIKKCHEMGTKVILFANLQPVDATTEWYKKELNKYQIINSKGMTNTQGWGMGTLGARMGYTKIPLVYCDLAFAEFRNILIDYFKKLAELGADGIHFDKANFWPEFSMDFNNLLEDGPDRAQLKGLLDCVDEIYKACKKINPEFCLSFESWWDRLLEYADGWWNWHDTMDHTPAMKYTFPEYLPNFTVIRPWDYNDVNNAIRYGYQILIGPNQFSTSMKEQQMLKISEYIREVINIRETLYDTIFTGDFLDTLGVKVKTSGIIKFNTHQNRKTGKFACVLVNPGQKSGKALVEFTDSKNKQAIIYKPFEKPFRTELPCNITIASERLAIVVEE